MVVKRRTHIQVEMEREREREHDRLVKEKYQNKLQGKKGGKVCPIPVTGYCVKDYMRKGKTVKGYCVDRYVRKCK
jgi:hypothetical protein